LRLFPALVKGTDILAKAVSKTVFAVIKRFGSLCPHFQGLAAFQRFPGGDFDRFTGRFHQHLLSELLGIRCIFGPNQPSAKGFQFLPSEGLYFAFHGTQFLDEKIHRLFPGFAALFNHSLGFTAGNIQTANPSQPGTEIQLLQSEARADLGQGLTNEEVARFPFLVALHLFFIPQCFSGFVLGGDGFTHLLIQGGCRFNGSVILLFRHGGNRLEERIGASAFFVHFIP